jgi:hypothetical protein
LVSGALVDQQLFNGTLVLQCTINTSANVSWAALVAVAAAAAAILQVRWSTNNWSMVPFF